MRIGALAARRQALRDDEAMEHDPTGVTQPGATSTVTSQTLARMSITLQRNNAMTLRTYLTDCLHHTNKSVPVPFRVRRPWQRPRLLERAQPLARMREGLCWATWGWRRRHPRCGKRRWNRANTRPPEEFGLMLLWFGLVSGLLKRVLQWHSGRQL